MLEVKRRFRESGNRTSLLPSIGPPTSTSVGLKSSLGAYQMADGRDKYMGVIDNFRAGSTDANNKNNL